MERGATKGKDFGGKKKRVEKGGELKKRQREREAGKGKDRESEGLISKNQNAGIFVGWTHITQLTLSIQHSFGHIE